ncbi:short chain dehydrogenase [Acetobacter senegalensis]|uniref:Short chain dehydrogenase n=1 Tax=Acetobacter senegalensis TaxID=446692 RepID=A0A0U5EXG3_9PROT|nr:SDR family oxidoreductase [Acetobacter senegalensis]CEF41600.1 short chain dehydrogenase [Acetobacter senegalensis]
MTQAIDKTNHTLEDRVVLVTGANGGLGEEFVQQALQRGARRVYAAARKPKVWNDARIVPLTLDITKADDIACAVATASDCDLLINNAAIAPEADVLLQPEAETRRIFDTNFFGTLNVANAFTPVLGANGGGTMLNILSVAAWISIPTAYAASKAALWSATNGLRMALEGQNTQVIGLLVGMIDTPMTKNWTIPKSSAASIVTEAYAGISAGALEILADDTTRDLKSRLNTKGEELYPWVHAQLRALMVS